MIDSTCPMIGQQCLDDTRCLHYKLSYMIFYNGRVITGCAMLQTYKSEALNSRSHRLSTFEKEKEELNPLHFLVFHDFS